MSTGGALMLGRYSTVAHQEFTEVVVGPANVAGEDWDEILVSGCFLTRCDLRQMKWSHLIACILIDCQLPLSGDKQTAYGCTIRTGGDVEHIEYPLIGRLEETR